MPPLKPIPGDGTDPHGLPALLQRYLVWIETHHFAKNTVVIRRLHLSRFIVWCEERSVTQARDVTFAMIERSWKRSTPPGCGAPKH